jgi:hypothetical protein
MILQAENWRADRGTEIGRKPWPAGRIIWERKLRGRHCSQAEDWRARENPRRHCLPHHNRTGKIKSWTRVNAQTAQARGPKRFLPLLRTRTEPSGKANQDTEAGNHRQKKNLRQKRNFSAGKKGTADRRTGAKSCVSHEWTRVNLMWNPKKCCAGKTSWNRSSCVRTRTLAQRPKQGGRVNCFKKSLSNMGRTALPRETRNQTENCPSGARHRQTTRGEGNRSRPRAPGGRGKMNQFQKQKLQIQRKTRAKSQSHQWTKITSPLKLKPIRIPRRLSFSLPYLIYWKEILVLVSHSLN